MLSFLNPIMMSASPEPAFIGYVQNTNGAKNTVTIPTGAIEGDMFIVIYYPDLKTLDGVQGSSALANGGGHTWEVAWKILTGADIAAGTVGSVGGSGYLTYQGTLQLVYRNVTLITVGDTVINGYPSGNKTTVVLDPVVAASNHQGFLAVQTKTGFGAVGASFSVGNWTERRRGALAGGFIGGAFDSFDKSASNQTITWSGTTDDGGSSAPVAWLLELRN